MGLLLNDFVKKNNVKMILLKINAVLKTTLFKINAVLIPRLFKDGNSKNIIQCTEVVNFLRNYCIFCSFLL